MSNRPLSDDGDDAELAMLVEEVTRTLEAGERVDLDAIERDFPEQAEPLRELLPALEAIVLVGRRDRTSGGSPGATRDVPRRLGDFRIVREIGRGGMGVVYEAEQLTMGRRVALKVLPFAAVAEEKSLQRFRNEVRAAATLDHPRIVSIYSVGESRGIHYYAMQLIRGQTLAELIEQLREKHLPRAATNGAGTSPGRIPPSSLDARAETQSLTGHRTQSVTRRNSERYRAAARLAIQAAEGLQHAHDLGVVHRDVKPSNLMVDGESNLFITDFGLARIGADAGLTHTGDFLGTLRYMAPEQALMKRVVIDHRADIYSLGATLYELLALEPAFGETDRARLLHQIAEEDPRPPRTIDRHIPVELETIVGKAMAKVPEQRYQTAQQLADDLKAYLDNRPIRARPPSMADRLRKWGWRNRALATMSIVAIAIVAVIATASGILLGFAFRSEQQHRRLAEQRLEIARRGNYNLQLAQVRDVWRYDPLRGVQLLEDEARCPPEYRDFTWRLYRDLCQRDRMTFGGHDGPVKDALYLADRQLMVSAELDGILRIFRLADGVEVSRVQAHAESITSLDASADEQRIASASRDGTIRIWSIEGTGENAVAREECVLDPQSGPIWDVCFSPDGRCVASGGENASARIWDLETKNSKALPIHPGAEHYRITSLDWSKSGDYLAAGTLRDDVWIWSTRDQEFLQTLVFMDRRLVEELEVALSDDGGLLAVGYDQGIELWDWKTKTLLRTLPGHSGRRITAMEFSPGGDRLITAGYDRTVRTWDIASSGAVAVLTGHGDRISSLELSADGGLLTASYDGTVKLWKGAELLDDQTISIEAESGGIIASFPREPILASSTKSGHVMFWDATTGRRRGRLRTSTLEICALALSPRGDVIATSGKDPTIYRHDPHTGQEYPPLTAHTRCVNALAYSPDGRYLASGGDDALVCIWDAKSGKLLHRLLGHSDRIWALSFAPRENVLASTGRDGTIRFWNPATGEPLDVYHEPEGKGIGCCVFSPDGRTLATATSRVSDAGEHLGTIHLWDYETGLIREGLLGHTDEVFSLAFTPDGQTLASAGRDRVVRLWDSVTGQERTSLEAHDSWVYCLAFGHDGSWLASSGKTGYVKIWNAANIVSPRERSSQTDIVADQSIRTFTGHTSMVYAIDVSADETKLASGDLLGSVKIWDIPTGNLERELLGVPTHVYSVGFSADGERLFTGYGNQFAHLWDIDAARIAQSLGGEYTRIYGRWSRDRELLAVTSWKNVGKEIRADLEIFRGDFKSPIKKFDLKRFGCLEFASDKRALFGVETPFHGRSIVKCLSLETGETLAQFPDYFGTIFSIVLSPDGRYLAVGGDDNDRLFEIMDVATRSKLVTPPGHTDDVMAIAFSPDGRLLASAGEEPSIRIWRTDTWELVHVLRGHRNGIHALRFLGDGKQLVSSGADHTIKFWNLEGLER